MFYKNLEHLVIKKINRHQGYSAVFGANLSSQELDELRTAIYAKPYLYVGQERVSFSTVPSFINHRIEPRNAILRNFVVAQGQDYLVMPGGLTRVAREKNEVVVSNQTGGTSKDTWIIGTEPEKPVNVTAQPGRSSPHDTVTEPLTSRAADNLFWVGRYIERMEAATRLLRMVLQKLREVSELNETTDAECLNVLLRTLTHVTGTYPGFVSGSASLALPQSELFSLVKDVHRSGSLAANLQGFVQSAFSIRDLWSRDTRRSIDNIQRRWQQRINANEVTLQQLPTYLDDLMIGIVSFTGLSTENMPREAGWLMLDSGRRLERALAMISLLRATLVIRHEDAILGPLLESVLLTNDSLHIYLRRYRSALQLPMVLELLLIDETHPRSIAYQLAQLSSHISAFPRERGKGLLSEETRLILKAYTDLRLSHTAELLAAEQDAGIYTELDGLLSRTVDLLWRIAEVIAQAYFSHSQPSQLVMPKHNPEDEL